ncbi:MAG TPA: CHAT domain-containing protein [Blastocatellia bacterium]|nr:CHAT domain-containing protein [Blastocatellia bacterium]
MAGKIKILFLAANPVDAGYRLRLDEEIREIGKKLRAGEYRGSFELVSEWAVRAGDLQEALLRHRPHIIHFSGHGSKTEGIALEDSAGRTKPINKEALARLFELLRDNIRVVVLNACYAKDQAGGLRETIDYTIGMSDKIGDRAAIVFAAYFYQALAFGHSVRKAFELAGLQLDLENIPGSKVPELLVRKGVSESRPFLEYAPPTSESGNAGKDSAVLGNIRAGGDASNSVIITGNGNSVNFGQDSGQGDPSTESSSKRTKDGGGKGVDGSAAGDNGNQNVEPSWAFRAIRGPLGVLKLAIDAVPAVKFSLGIAGIAATVAIIKTFVTDLRVAFFGTIVMIFLMVILFLFAQLTTVVSKQVQRVLPVLIWSCLLLFIGTSASLFSSVFFKWPVDLQGWTITTDGDTQVEYHGKVTDGATQQAVVGASVTVQSKGSSQVYSTDPDGVFRFKISTSARTARLLVVAKLYGTYDQIVSLPGNSSTDVPLTLRLIAQVTPTPTPTVAKSPGPKESPASLPHNSPSPPPPGGLLKAAATSWHTNKGETIGEVSEGKLNWEDGTWRQVAIIPMISGPNSQNIYEEWKWNGKRWQRVKALASPN